MFLDPADIGIRVSGNFCMKNITLGSFIMTTDVDSAIICFKNMYAFKEYKSFDISTR